MNEFVCDAKYRELIPDGQYEAQCVRCDESVSFGKDRKLYLIFKIIEAGEHIDKELFMAFRMPYNKKISAGSKYYKAWVKVNNWQKPSRNAKMSSRFFLNKIYTIRTRTVQPPYDGKPMPENHWYSVVDAILGVNA